MEMYLFCWIEFQLQLIIVWCYFPGRFGSFLYLSVCTLFFDINGVKVVRSNWNGSSRGLNVFFKRLNIHINFRLHVRHWSVKPCTLTFSHMFVCLFLFSVVYLKLLFMQLVGFSNLCRHCLLDFIWSLITHFKRFSFSLGLAQICSSASGRAWGQTKLAFCSSLKIYCLSD